MQEFKSLIKFIPLATVFWNISKILRFTDLSERHFRPEFYECVAQTFAQQFKFI